MSLAQRTHDYSVGKKVYRGGSNAPDPQRKDPSGYVQRENKNKNSDKRSGKAAAMLRVRDKMQEEDNAKSQSKQPLIPDALTPVGDSGLMKSPTGRIYRGRPNPSV